MELSRAQGYANPGALEFQFRLKQNNATYTGILWGIRSRTAPYEFIHNIVGQKWDECDRETAATVYAYRIRAKNAGISPKEYEAFMYEVVRPILSDDEPNKLERVRKAIATVESALPVAETKPR